MRAIDKVGHNVGIIIGSQPKSGGPRRSATIFGSDPAADVSDRTLGFVPYTFSDPFRGIGGFCSGNLVDDVLGEIHNLGQTLIKVQ